MSISIHFVARTSAGFGQGRAGPVNFVVGDTGIEPVTPSMSTKCSTAELITHFFGLINVPQTKMGREIPRRCAAIKGVVRGIKGLLAITENAYYPRQRGGA